MNTGKVIGIIKPKFVKTSKLWCRSFREAGISNILPYTEYT